MIPQRWQALAYLVDARFREFMREPEVIFWVYGFPLALAVGLGFAFKSTAPEAGDIDVANTPSLARAEATAKTLREAKPLDGNQEISILPSEECKHRLRIGKTAAYLVLGDKEIECIHDPTRADSAQARFWVEAVLLRDAQSKTVTVRATPVTEPGARYIDFLLPGLVGTNIMGGGLFGVGFALVDMRVRKLFKRLMATPMRHSDFLLSFLVSRGLFLLPEMAILLGMGNLVLGVPIEGSFFTLLIVILAGTAAFAGIGMLLAARTEKSESASGLLNLVMMPQYILSGVFFSSKRFPDEVQYFVQALPLTQLIDALREVMLEGKSLLGVSWRLAILVAYAVVTFTLALKWFRWR
ncbi:MAG: ABC transporter permease [Planctomycetes bacterium]|nr:ABC transporter permease [Planctomycetota bacterium]